MMWDVVDDRIYALSSFNPSGEKKLTNPGPEALAILGLSRHPVFCGKSRTHTGRTNARTLTRGCSGSWSQGSYIWPLWSMPASPKAVDSSRSRHLRHRTRLGTTVSLVPILGNDLCNEIRDPAIR